MRLRVFEVGISCYGRTYDEGKKIRARDGLRALYCIFHYNAPTAPFPVQFIIYLLVGGVAALFNLFAFQGLLKAGMNVSLSAAVAFVSAAGLNYWLCIALLFRYKARWSSTTEVVMYSVVIARV